MSKPRRYIDTCLTVTYKCTSLESRLNTEKDAAIRKALGKYETGSGYSFSDGVRDHSATVPDNALKTVLRDLKKIRGITTKKLVQKWVLCR